MSTTADLEIEIKISYPRGADAAGELIESRGYRVSKPRVFESNTLFDRESGELRNSDRLFRLRRVEKTALVTYKGPSLGGPHKSREEIEFDVSDADRFTRVLERLGYLPTFRYEKYRTTFARTGEPGEITIDETPMGIFLELEGEAGWIDRTAADFGFSTGDYITASYAVLYRQYRSNHPGAPADMTF